MKKFFSASMPQPVASGLMDTYVNIAEQRASSVSDNDLDAHHAKLRQWARELDHSMPFPNSLAARNPPYKDRINFETIDLEPHHFELAKLVDTLGWMTRFQLRKGGGSASEGAELFASRGLSYQKILFEREAEDRQVFRALTAGVMQCGNCDSNAAFAENLFRSIDREILDELGINLQPERIRGIRMQDYLDDHVYTVVAPKDEMPREYDGSIPLADGQRRNGSLLPSEEASALWSLDAHQFYPMACRHDHSSYNHLEHTEARYRLMAGSDGHTGVNMQFIEDVGVDLNRALNLGERGIDHALQEPVMLGARIRSKFVDRIMHQQNVGHYARVDTDLLSAPDREKFLNKVKQIEREIGRKFLKRLYKAGEIEEYWEGLCLPANPARFYRQRENGEILAPRVPPAYFEQTEKIRWAYDIWKRTRPERDALNRPIKLARPKFNIHPAIEAIENMPFLSALAAAKELDFSANERHTSQIAAYKIAYTSMADWINCLHNEMQSTPDLSAKLRKVGLHDEVRAALASTQANLRELDAIMQEFRDNMSTSEQSDFDTFLTDSRKNLPGAQLEELVSLFRPSRNARTRLHDLLLPQIAVNTSTQPPSRTRSETQAA